MTNQPHFDVFLAHNNLDKPLVRIVAKKLKQYELIPWLDEEEILPGQYFQDAIQRVIPQVTSAAIFISPLGLGRWQDLELKVFISQCVKRNIPIIPVLLPGIDTIPESLVFLAELNYVQFVDGIDDRKALERLVLGIRKQKIGDRLSPNIQQSVEDNLVIEKLKLLDEKSNKEFVVNQIGESIGEIEKYLERLRNEKKIEELKIERLKENISRIEAKLREEVNQQLREVIDWLKENQKNLAEKSGSFALNEFSELKKELEVTRSCTKFFYWIIEQFLEEIRYSLYDKEPSNIDSLLRASRLEELRIPKSFINPYLKSLNYIQNYLGKSIQEKVFSEIEEKVEKLIDEMKSFLTNLERDIG